MSVDDPSRKSGTRFCCDARRLPCSTDVVGCRPHRSEETMKRREAIVLLGGAVIAPLPLSAQSSSRVWRVGLLETTPMDLNAPNINAFRQSLQDLGYVEGQNLIIAYRSAEGRGERFTELTTELLRAGPRVSFMLPPSHEF